ncbi:ArnT family glycosyltransferase, partial [Verrucomicrobiota bacterium]
MSIQEKAQAVINSLDQGVGLWLTRLSLLLFFVFALYGYYAFSQFRGLASDEAMENAHLGRRLAEGHGFTTRCIRPLDLWYLSEHGAGTGSEDGWPDIRHAPLYPWLLSLGFRLRRPSFDVEPGMGVFAPERDVVIPIGVLCSVLTGLVVFLFGRRVFDTRVGLTAMILFFVTDSVLQTSISGTRAPLLMLLTAAASYAALDSSLRRTEGGRPVLWILSFSASALLCGLLFLAAYEMALLVPVLLLFLVSDYDRGRWPAVLAFLLIFGLVAGPWIVRNSGVGGVLGSAPYAVFRGSQPYAEDGVDRSVEPSADMTRALEAMRTRLPSDLRRLYETDLRTLAGGLIVCFFIVSFFHRFDSDEAGLFRWCIALGLLLTLGLGALGGGPDGDLLGSFTPLVLLYGTAFFFVVIEQAGFFEYGGQAAFTWLLILLTAVPAALRIAGPRPGRPYPPYFPPFVSYVCGLLDEDETLCTDVPWATAWYGDRDSVLLPRSVDELLAIHRERVPLHG